MSLTHSGSHLLGAPTRSPVRMGWTTLVSAEQLLTALSEPNLVIVDCRFDLKLLTAGLMAYRKEHIPKAVYMNLNTDLSDLTKKDRGRHPLPGARDFCRVLEKAGITPEMQVVAYDGSHGAFAARFWWMMRLLGHEHVAVLDGGMRAWRGLNAPLTNIRYEPVQSTYNARFDVGMTATTAVVAARCANQFGCLVDARAAQRFAGEEEPIDPVAGHIPGAINRPFTKNLDDDSRFLPMDVLNAQWRTLLQGVSAKDTILMCGSGVTACHNRLAMEHARLRGARVYIGSWSEWIANPARPVVLGNE